MLFKYSISICPYYKDKVNNFYPKLKDKIKIFQPFKNHVIDFAPPRITEKHPMSGVDKWLEEQNNKLESTFNAVIHRLETLY